MAEDIRDIVGSGIGAGLDICVVDDDDGLREETVRALAEFGFRVRGFQGARELYRGLLGASCHIVILDLGLPGEDGFSIARHLKEITDVGVVIVTARSHTGDRVRGLMEGADAYLVKPVEIAELAATLRSLARRLGVKTGAAPAATGGWHLTLDGWCLVAPSGARISLSPSERAVLGRLAREPDLPVSRDALIAALGHDTEYYYAHRLDMLISRLRRKTLQLAGSPLPLKAVRGIGFAFSAMAGENV